MRIQGESDDRRDTGRSESTSRVESEPTPGDGLSGVDDFALIVEERFAMRDFLSFA